jgi:hypothetical protein
MNGVMWTKIETAKQIMKPIVNPSTKIGCELKRIAVERSVPSNKIESLRKSLVDHQ